MIAAAVAAIVGRAIYVGAASLAIATSPDSSTTHSNASGSFGLAITFFIVVTSVASLGAGTGPRITKSDRRAM
jgi:hypothetical protein